MVAEERRNRVVGGMEHKLEKLQGMTCGFFCI